MTWLDVDDDERATLTLVELLVRELEAQRGAAAVEPLAIAAQRLVKRLLAMAWDDDELCCAHPELDDGDAHEYQLAFRPIVDVVDTGGRL